MKAERRTEHPRRPAVPHTAANASHMAGELLSPIELCTKASIHLRDPSWTQVSSWPPGPFHLTLPSSPEFRLEASITLCEPTGLLIRRSRC